MNRWSRFAAHAALWGFVAAAAFCACVTALKSVDLPTSGRPTMPHLMPIGSD